MSKYNSEGLIYLFLQTIKESSKIKSEKITAEIRENKRKKIILELLL